MRSLAHILILAAGVLLLAAKGFPALAQGGGRVEVELFTEARAPITAAQQWARALAQAGLDSVQIRSGSAANRVSVTTRPSPAGPTYVVTGVINSANQLLTPAGRFRLSEADRFARWLDELARYGPADQRPQKGAFGLTGGQLGELREGLRARVGFPTKGVPRDEVVRKILANLRAPLQADRAVLAAVGTDPVSADLASLSCGTALAYTLRAPGLALVPQATARESTKLTIVRARAGMEAWPVGWEPEKPTREVLPRIFQFLKVNVQGVSVLTVLEEVSKRLELPVLLDHNAMARHGVEPEKAMVNLPQSRTTYSLLLRRTLAQAGLKSEVRVDEAGKPFLWVTTLKPI